MQLEAEEEARRQEQLRIDSEEEESSQDSSSETVEIQMRRHATTQPRRKTISAEAIRPYQPPPYVVQTGAPNYYYRSPRYPQPPPQYAAPRPYVAGGRYILYQQPATQRPSLYGARYYGSVSGNTVSDEDPMI